MTRSGPPGAGVRQRKNCSRNCLRERGQTKFKFAIFMPLGKPKRMGGGDGGCRSVEEWKVEKQKSRIVEGRRVEG